MKLVVIFIFLAIVMGACCAHLTWQILHDDQTDLQRVQIQKEIAKIELQQMKLAQKQDVMQSASVQWAQRVTATVLHAWPLVCLVVGVCGMWMYQLKHVPVKAGDIETSLPRKAVVPVVTHALTVREAEARVQEVALSDEAMKNRLQVVTSTIKTLKTELKNASQIIDVTPDVKALPVYVPTFYDLMRSGELAPGKSLVFGVGNAGDLKTGGWVDLFSNAIGGQSGQGKTATLRSLIAQSLLTEQVDEFWIVDYHYPHPKSLLASLGKLKELPCVHYVENPFHTAQLLKDVDATIDRRLRLEESSDNVKVLVCDEVLILCDRVKGMTEIIKRIGTESRKCNIFGLFSSQTWKAEAVGGSEVRDCLTSRYAHRMQRKQANLLLQDAEQAKVCQGLKTGQALFSPANGDPEILHIPHCRPADMEHVFLRVANGPGPVSQFLRVDQGSQPASQPDVSEEGETLDWIDRVNKWVQKPGNSQKKLVDLTGLGPAYISRILSRKQDAGPDVQHKILKAMKDNVIDFPQHE